MNKIEIYFDKLNQRLIQDYIVRPVSWSGKIHLVKQLRQERKSQI